MGKVSTGGRLLLLAKTMFRRVFPKRVDFPLEIMEVLSVVYPVLDLKNVRFYEGLPWFIDYRFASAITLPGVYNLSQTHIYFGKIDYHSVHGYSTIVHECFHALQYQELYKSRGIGLFRVFMVHYLAEFFGLFFKNVSKLGIFHARQMAYELHPMEIPAYSLDRKFQKFLKDQGTIHVKADCIPPELIVMNTGHQYKAGQVPYWLTVLLLVFLTMLAPVIELILLIFSGIFFLVGKVLSLIRI